MVHLFFFFPWHIFHETKKNNDDELGSIFSFGLPREILVHDVSASPYDPIITTRDRTVNGWRASPDQKVVFMCERGLKTASSGATTSRQFFFFFFFYLVHIFSTARDWRSSTAAAVRNFLLGKFVSSLRWIAISFLARIGSASRSRYRVQSWRISII